MTKTEIIELPKIFDPRGSLTVAEENKNIPFAFESITWLYGAHVETVRKGCTSKKGNKLFVALSGSFNVEVVEEGEKMEWMLNHPFQGLWVKSDAIYTLSNFSNGAICLEISSEGDAHAN